MDNEIAEAPTAASSHARPDMPVVEAPPPLQV